MSESPDRFFVALAEAWRRPAWRATALFGLTLLAYAPALHAGFIWDDDTMLTANPLIAAHDGLRRLWFSTQTPDYWPVTYTSFWLEWRLWGNHAAGYHLTNVLLHAATVLLLWTVLRQWRIPGAFLAAALFAVHPLNVEAVAWIAQRKGLLALLFALLCVGCYGKKGRGWYVLSLLLFLLALLSKATVATLPLALLLLVRRSRAWRWSDAARAAPFFVMAAALVAVNIWFQRHGTGAVIRTATLGERILGAGAVVWFYAGKALLPVHLAFYYPAWRIQASHLLWWLPLLGAAGLTAWLWRHRHTPACAAVLWAWLIFVVALVPVMGLTDVYFMKFSLVADHYGHLALVAFVGLAGAGWARWDEAAARRRGRWSWIPTGTAVVLVAALGWLTWRRCQVFRDPATLYAATLKENPNSSLAHNNWGAQLLDEGRLGEAEAHFAQGLRLSPDDPDLNYNEGSVLFKLGRSAAAIGPLERAVRAKPDFPNALNNLGNALAENGRVAEAVGRYEQAIRLQPGNAEFHADLALALSRLGRHRDAAGQYRETLRIDPKNAEARHGLGVCEAELGNLAAAVDDDEEAIRLDPGSAGAYNDLGIALARLGRPDEALARWLEALRLRPDFAEAHANAGLVLAREGRAAEAIAQFRAALKLRPDYPGAKTGLERALQAEEAVKNRGAP